MPGIPRIRGKINVVLNGLVRTGVIAGFRTNFGDPDGAHTPLVSVTAIEGQSPEDARVAVMNALMTVAIGIDVTAERA